MYQSPWQDLANAIVQQAAEDYRWILRHIDDLNPEKQKQAAQLKRELDRFFRSRWYARLTTLEPDCLLRRLQTEQKQKSAATLKKERQKARRAAERMATGKPLKS